jgi:hypothetical protein
MLRVLEQTILLSFADSLAVASQHCGCQDVHCAKSHRSNARSINKCFYETVDLDPILAKKQLADITRLKSCNG